VVFDWARAAENGEAVDKEDALEPTPEQGAKNSDVEAKAQAARRRGRPAIGYQQLLGETLGPKLHSVVSDLITMDKLAGYARSGLEAGLSSLGEEAKKSPGSSAADVDLGVQALERHFLPIAEQYVKDNAVGFQAGLQDFVDANPVAVTMLGLLAASAVVAADMPLPEFGHTIRMDNGLELYGGAQLGTLQHLAVERITARFTYMARDFRARIEASYRPDDDRVNTEFGFDYRMNDNLDVYGRGNARTPIHDSTLDPGDHRGRVGVRWRPKKDMEVEGYGETSEEHGAGAGVNFRWKF